MSLPSHGGSIYDASCHYPTTFVLAVVYDAYVLNLSTYEIPGSGRTLPLDCAEKHKDRLTPGSRMIYQTGGAKKTRWITPGHDQQEKQKHLSREHSEPLERHHGQLVLKKNDSRNMALAHAQYIELDY